jgi:hypothetical protein
MTAHRAKFLPEWDSEAFKDGFQAEGTGHVVALGMIKAHGERVRLIIQAVFGIERRSGFSRE